MPRIRLVDENRLKAMGQARQVAGAQTLPLVIRSSDPAIQQLPWETLYHPHYGFLGLANGFTLLRTNPSVTPTLAPPEAGQRRCCATIRACAPCITRCMAMAVG